MKKSDLKTGMWVETKEGKRYIIVVESNEPCMIYPSGHQPIAQFPKAVPDDSYFDIVKVWKYVGNSHIGSSFQYDNWVNQIDFENSIFELIWENNLKETIKIGDNIYNKAEFEDAVKDLKPIN
jgi:hypothetical protein